MAEWVRYQPQIMLPEIGRQGQQKLAQAKVLCVGAGGLAATVTSYLVASGIGSLTIIDDDVIELSNLQRQVFFTEQEIGLAKSSVLAARLSKLNSEVNIVAQPTRLIVDNAVNLVTDYEIIIDASDNYQTKYLLNDVAYYLNKKLVSASVQRFCGQLLVFAFPSTPCYRCLFPRPGLSANCAQAGILGMVPGVFGLLQALEVVKLILGLPNLAGKLLSVDFANYLQRVYQLTAAADCQLCTKRSSIHELNHAINCKDINMEISVTEFKKLPKEDYFLLDVREYEEYVQDNLGGTCIPLSQLATRLAELPKNQLIIVHCHAGVRGERAVYFLSQHGYLAKNLIGGMAAYRSA